MAQPYASSSRSIPGQSRASSVARPSFGRPSSGPSGHLLPKGEGIRAPSPSGRGVGVRAFITPPRGRSAPACARRPTGSPKCRRPSSPRDGRGSRPPADWRRRPGRRRARPSAGQPPGRSPRRSPSCPRGWREAPARRAPGTRSRGYRAAGPGAQPAPRRGRRPAATMRSNSESPPMSSARGKRS